MSKDGFDKYDIEGFKSVIKVTKRFWWWG